MSRPKVFSPETEREIAQRAAAGESTVSIAKALGTSHQNVQNALKRCRGTLAPDADDEFERRQLATLRLIRRKMRDDESSPMAIAALVKAQNDTIKAIRQHRLMHRKASGTDEEQDVIADQVKARLRRLSEVGQSVASVPDEDKEDPEAATG